MSAVALDVAAVRARFSALDRPTAFFDAPGGTQTPDSVIEAMAAYLRESNANLGGAFEIIRSVFEPGAESGPEKIRPTEEAGYIVSGTLELWISDKHLVLRAGDSFRFANEPYRWRNPGPDPTEAIWVIAPPVY